MIDHAKIAGLALLAAIASREVLCEQNVLLETKFTRVLGEVVDLSATESSPLPNGSRILTSGSFSVRGRSGLIKVSMNQATGALNIEMPSGPGAHVRWSPQGEETTLSLSKDPADGSVATSAAPSLLVASGEEAAFEVSDAPVHYFEREGEEWKLKSIEGAGLKMSVLPRIGEGGQVVFDELSVTTTAMVGRERIQETGLDVGKPILAREISGFSFEAKAGTTYWLWTKVDENQGALLVGIRATVVDGKTEPATE